jgi:hypothetical protein
MRATSKALDPKAKQHSKLVDEIQSLLVKGDDLSLLLLQTNHDSSHIFANYLREGLVPTKDVATTTADRNLCDAIEECERFVSGWSQRTKADPLALVSLLRNQLSVIFHEIEDEGLVYTVFEVLNSRGLDVTWFDKLKSLLMAVVFEHGDAGGRSDTLDELHNIWRDIYGTIGLRQNLNRETVRFAGTLYAKAKPSRPLGEEDSVREIVAACGKKATRVVQYSKWLLKIVAAEDRLLSNYRMRATREIVQARLVAIAVFLRGFDATQEAAILRRWENVTFRIYGMLGNDARTGVGDFVRLGWEIQNSHLTHKDILERLSEIGKDYPIDEAVEGLVNEDCYSRWKEQLRYFFFRYEEALAESKGQKLNESQWNKIWQDEPSKSIEHIRPQSFGSDDPKTSGIFVHRLGNLTMLPPGVNSKLQDADPRDKAKTYKSCGLLGAIEVAELIQSGKKWNRAAVERREMVLVEWARKEWGG